MKKIILVSFIAITLAVLSSFKTSASDKYIGVYGVSENDPSGIELVLNEDQTYTFKDFSNPNQHINVSGNWTFNKNQFILLNNSSNNSFHSKWKVTKDGKVAKSRKGLSFYTLMKK